MKKTQYYQSGLMAKNLESVRSKAVANSSKARSLAREERITVYNNNPKLCEHVECKSPIPYDKKTNKFCSHSCGAKVSNASRDPSHTKLFYTKTASCVKCNNLHNVDPRRSIKKFVCDQCKTVYPHSKVHCTTCKFCNNKFYTQTPSSVCKGCQHLKWNNNKNQYSFTFNVWDYPALFDLEMLRSKGWVAFGGKRGGNKNPSGLSRDHKVSVSHAKKHGYDPYYISHPCNCAIMPHTENNKKKSSSSITYAQLVAEVDAYDQKVHT